MSSPGENHSHSHSQKNYDFRATHLLLFSQWEMCVIREGYTHARNMKVISVKRGTDDNKSQKKTKK